MWNCCIKPFVAPEGAAQNVVNCAMSLESASVGAEDYMSEKKKKNLCV